jgi:lipopolysaccharide export system permease protein
MKLVTYLYKKFMLTFICAMVFFCMVLSLTDLFINLWGYISRGVALKQVAAIMVYYIPKTVWYSIPISMLFSTAYVLSDLYAKNELTAMFASGISLVKFTSPLLVIAIIMSFGMFFFEDNLVVPSYAKKQTLQKQALHKEQSLDSERVVIMSEEGKIIYKADLYDDKQSRLYGLYILFRNEDRSMDMLVKADDASWETDHWVLGNSTAYKKVDNGLEQCPLDDEHRQKITEPPATFRNSIINVEEVNTKVAREYISHLQKAGLPSGEARSLYYKKFSFPCIVFIVVFLAIGLSGKTQKNVLLVSLGLSICAVVLFYILQMVTMLMAKFGTIPAMFGAWFPVFCFILISMVLLHYSRT